ncbi:hypothetical protein LPJ57_008715 [Coemansia sp. RSA 486]|nr:hypothetical protein LPJ57_008715 [Coemansia sp. RSA 486]
MSDMTAGSGPPDPSPSPREETGLSSEPPSPSRQYASINNVPPLQEHAVADRTASIASLAAPIIRRASLDGPGASAPLTAFSSGSRSSAELQSRHPVAETQESSRISTETASLPFTYSGVFSSDRWKQAHSAGQRAMSHMYSGGRMNHASSTLAHSYLPGALCAEDSSSSSDESDSLDEDDEESDTESYEGLAVDDINETYDQSLPEYGTWILHDSIGALYLTS